MKCDRCKKEIKERQRYIIKDKEVYHSDCYVENIK